MIPDLVALAGARNAKMVLAGDTGQLQAVENGGVMSLLAGALGYVLVADAVQAPVGSAQARSRTADVEMIDAQPHRPVHQVAVKVIARHSAHLAALITAGSICVCVRGCVHGLGPRFDVQVSVIGADCHKEVA